MYSIIFKPNRYNSFAWTNIVALLLLLYFGKVEPYTVIFGYFLETIIIGVFNVIKMYISSKHHKSEKSVAFLIPFFIFHYGFFIAVQSIFVFVIMEFGDVISVKEPFDLITNYGLVFKLKGMEYIIGLLLVTQLAKYVFDYIQPQKYLRFTPEEIMFKPYVRILIQQFAVILAMFFIMFSNADVMAAILLILIRAIVDFFLVGIRDNEALLNRIVDKMYDGKTSKEELKKQLILFSE
ncbi:DUF6498-containing protein [Seonamhaeicola maritimus]|uniref:Uncharacterized protein n=1 Tax=Seonamhaeicola maritimus TaxID=2591822 RepID=A0A5C7GE36_9FLAO|nr:DUF6498-containing protein [Seonamhaeicola maritimus]TXG34713.1 hypothetical protein FUA22_17545 [Seonamhaeicola maritimus]